MSGISGYSKESLLNQAQNVWTMLDDMAESSPDKYKEFIDKQMKEAKEYMKPPEPNMCVQTSLQAPKQWKLYINFCSWNRVNEPKTDEDPIPVIGTELQKEKEESENVIITSVAFHPRIIEDFGRHSSHRTERDLLINLAFKYVESQHSVQISRNYHILGGNVVFKGNMEKIRQTFMNKTAHADKEFEQNMSDLQKNFAPFPADAKESFLNKFANIGVSDDSKDSEPIKTQPNGFDIKLPSSDKGQEKKGLIEEISSTDLKITTTCPKYTLDCIESDSGTEMKVKVTLDGVLSVRECCLDISQDDMKLEVDDRYSLHIKFPKQVVDDEASAKFSKKTSVLSVTVPVV